MNPQADVRAARCGEPANDADGIAADYRFAGNLPVFAGHFPDRPLVPGVYLLAAMQDLLERSATGHGQLTGLRRVKFRQPISPDTLLRIRLAWRTGGAISGTVHVGDDLAAQASLLCN